MATKSEILTQIRTAISSIMSGGAVQDYSVNGRSLRRYSLKELMDLEAKYERDVAMTSAPRSQVVRFNTPE